MTHRRRLTPIRPLFAGALSRDSPIIARRFIPDYITTSFARLQGLFAGKTADLY